MKAGTLSLSQGLGVSRVTESWCVCVHVRANTLEPSGVVIRVCQEQPWAQTQLDSWWCPPWDLEESLLLVF